MYRLGEKKKLVNRPLKIVLESEEEKNLVLKNLYQLKGAEDWHFKVRISRDLTKEERKAIKRLSNIAKGRNEKGESNVIWCVRDSLSRGVYLKKTEKQQEDDV